MVWVESTLKCFAGGKLGFNVRLEWPYFHKVGSFTTPAVY